MKTSAIGYYADFIVFPVILAGLISITAFYGIDHHLIAWLVAAFAGAFFWSFLEYAIHRFILHNGLYFSQDHDKHHEAPKALIATPVWVTLAIMLFAIYLPSVYFLGHTLGFAFSFGLTAGYLFYSFAHYVLHHWKAQPDGLFYKWKRIHLLHHYSSSQANFGVTSSFWDHVFGTAARPKSLKPLEKN